MKKNIFLIVFAIFISHGVVYSSKINLHYRIDFGVDKSIDYGGDLTINICKYTNWPVIDTVYTGKTKNGEIDFEIESNLKYIFCYSFDIDTINQKYIYPFNKFWPFEFNGWFFKPDSDYSDPDPYYSLNAKSLSDEKKAEQTGYLCNEQGDPCKGFLQNYDNQVLANGAFKFRTCSAGPYKSIFVIPNDSNYVPGYWYKDSTTVEWLYKGTPASIDDTSSIVIKLKKVKRLGGKYSFTGKLFAGITKVKDPIKRPNNDIIQSIPDSSRMIGEIPVIYVYDENNDVVAYTYDIKNDYTFTVYGLKPGKYRIKPEQRILSTGDKWITIKEGDPFDIVQTGVYDRIPIIFGSDTKPNKEVEMDIKIRQVTVSAKSDILKPGDIVHVKLDVEIISSLSLAGYTETTARITSCSNSNVPGAFECLNFPLDKYGFTRATKCSTSGKFIYYDFELRIDTLLCTTFVLKSEIHAPGFGSPMDIAILSFNLSSDSTYLTYPGVIEIGVNDEPSSEITPSAYPNPINSGSPLKISWKQEVEADAAAEIYSYAGICISKIPLGILPSGFQTAFIPTDGFLPGAYYVLIRSGGELMKAKFVVK